MTLIPTPFKAGPGYLEEVWNTLGTAELMAIMALHTGVYTLLEHRRELARRKQPLITADATALTPRGTELAQWAIATKRWVK